MSVDETARYVPTSGEIQRECAKIRANWNGGIRRSRQSIRAVSWSIPDYGGIDAKGPTYVNRKTHVTSLSE